MILVGDRAAKPVRWPKVTREQVNLANALAPAAADIALDLAGKTYSWRLVAWPLEHHPQIALEGIANGNRAVLRLDMDPFARLIELPLSAADLKDLPDTLRNAVLDLALKDCIGDHLETLGLTFELQTLITAGDAMSPFEGPSLGFQLWDETKRLVARGDILMQPGLASKLAETFASRPVSLGEAAINLAALPAVARIEVGRTEIDVAVMRAVSYNDIVLVDQHDWGQQIATLAIDGYWRYRIKVDEETMTIIDDDNPDDPRGDQDAPPAKSIEELTVPVTIDLGRIELTLGEVAQIAQGTTLDLAKSTDGSVDLRVHGRLIGRGQLVDIEGRLGVRVTEIFPNANG